MTYPDRTHPQRTPLCTDHSDDEWCDDCFIPSIARQTVADLDMEAWEDVVAEAVAAASDVMRPIIDKAVDDHVKYVASLPVTDELLADAHPLPATRFCVNRRHTDGRHATASCHRPYPPASFIHRAVGAVAVGSLVGAMVGAVAVAEAHEWWRTVGRLHVAAAKQRAHDAWCRTVG